jgi:hypothetical protein
MPRSRSIVRAALLLSSLAAVISCDSPAGPDDGLLLLVGSPSTRDTILALPSQPLIVEFRDERNRPVPNAHLAFRGRKSQAADSLLGKQGVFACPLSYDQCTVPSDTEGWIGESMFFGLTDASGRAVMRVQFGQVAGSTAIEVSHAESGISLTIPFETVAGALAGARTPVQDTVIHVGDSYVLAAEAADRLDNPRSGTVTVTALDPTVATYTAGTVTAVSMGRARFAMAAGAATDTAYVSVPPEGRLAAMGPAATAGGTSRLTLVNLDGTGRRVLVTTYGNSGYVVPAWTPTRDRIIYQEAVGFGGDVVLRAIDTLGNPSTAFAVSPGVAFAMQPAFSPAEGKLYLYGHSNAGFGIYRVEPDGTGAVYLHPGVQPGPSPDGTRIAFVIGDSVKTRDLGTGDEYLLGLIGVLPRWSPAGDEVAYIDQATGGLMLVHPDGTGSRRVSETVRYGGLVSFSPDGAWVLAANEVHLDLIRVSDGLRLPLVPLRGFYQPAWR